MIFGGIIVGLGGSLDNGVEGEGWCNLDEWNMEDFGGHARLQLVFV